MNDATATACSWVVISVMVTLEPTMGGGIRKSYHRVLGTLAGGLAGLAALYLAFAAAGGQEWASEWHLGGWAGAGQLHPAAAPYSRLAGVNHTLLAAHICNRLPSLSVPADGSVEMAVMVTVVQVRSYSNL